MHLDEDVAAKALPSRSGGVAGEERGVGSGGRAGGRNQALWGVEGGEERERGEGGRTWQ